MLITFIFLISFLYPHASYDGHNRPPIKNSKERILNNIELNLNSLNRNSSNGSTETPVDYNLLVLLIDFNDQSMSFTKEDFQSHLFNENTPSGSLTDYYSEVSYGKFNLTGNVYGAYASSRSESETYDPSGINTDKISDYITSALEEADAEVDFSNYDNDNNGVVDVVLVVYPGAGGDQGRGQCRVSKAGVKERP